MAIHWAPLLLVAAVLYLGWRVLAALDRIAFAAERCSRLLEGARIAPVRSPAPDAGDLVRQYAYGRKEPKKSADALSDNGAGAPL